MRKLMSYLTFIGVFGLLSLAIQEEVKPFLDEDVAEQTDIFAIPLDRSADVDESDLARIRAYERKSREDQEKKL